MNFSWNLNGKAYIIEHWYEQNILAFLENITLHMYSWIFYSKLINWTQNTEKKVETVWEPS